MRGLAFGPSLRVVVVYGLAVAAFLEIFNASAHSGQTSAPVKTRVAIISPTDARPGEEVSGIVTLDPKQYENIPGVQVTLTEVALERDERGQPTLRGSVVDTGDGPPQAAERPIKFRIPGHLGGVPNGGNALKFLFSRGGATASSGTASLPVNMVNAPTPLETAAASTGQATDFSEPPVANPGELEIIRGPFDGNITTSSIVIDGMAMRLIAETPRACYYQIPFGIPAGLHHVTLHKGARTINFDLYIVTLELKVDLPQIHRGQTTTLRATVLGVDQMPGEFWTGGSTQELIDPASLAASAPGFHPPAAGAPGQILITIANGSPQFVTLVGAKNETVEITLTSQNASGHPYAYSGNVLGKRDGTFTVIAKVRPFLAAVAGTDEAGAGNSPAQPGGVNADKFRQGRTALESKEEEARKATRAADKASKLAAAQRGPGAAQSQQQALALRQHANSLNAQAAQLGTQSQQLASTLPPSTFANILRAEARNYRAGIAVAEDQIKKLRSAANEKHIRANLEREAASRFSTNAEKQKQLAVAQQYELDSQKIADQADDIEDNNTRLRRKAGELERQTDSAEKPPSGAGHSPLPDEGTVDIPPGATVPDSILDSVYTPERLKRDLAIGAAFSPVVYEGVGDTPRGDMITNFDFDGDWIGDNNWDHAVDKRFPLHAWVYFSVAETPTHFFVHYAFYHARDYKGGLKKSYALKTGMAEAIPLIGGDPTGISEDIALSHENDLEGCLVVARKHGENPASATVLYVEALAHNKFAKYHNPGIPTPGAETIQLRGQHPLVFAEAKGHGVSRYTGEEKQIKNGSRGMFIYNFTGVAEVQEQTGSREVGYDLMPIFPTLWAHAQHGANETYGVEHNYEILEIMIKANPNHDPRIQPPAGPLGSAFRGDVGFENKSRPPWGWYDMSEKNRPLGEWFFDPAAVIARHYHLGMEFSLSYTFDIYFGILH